MERVSPIRIGLVVIAFVWFLLAIADPGGWLYEAWTWGFAYLIAILIFLAFVWLIVWLWRHAIGASTRR